MWKLSNGVLVDEQGQTWPEFVVKNQGSFKYWVMFRSDNRVIISVNDNGVQNLWPVNHEVAGCDVVPADFQSNTTWVFSMAGKIEQDLNLVKRFKAGSLTSDYVNSPGLTVDFTTEAGLSSTFQADADARKNMVTALSEYKAIGSVPSDYYWLDINNQQVPFNLTDLTSLVQKVSAMYWNRFKTLQNNKATVRGAGSVTAVNAV